MNKKLLSVLQDMPNRLIKEKAKNLNYHIQFNVDGAEEFKGYLDIQNESCSFSLGSHSNPSCVVKTSADVWLDIIYDKLDGTEAFLKKLFVSEGDISILSQLKTLFLPPEDFTKEEVKESDYDELGGNLIFVICSPRSGSTLLQYMLASNSQLHTLSEPWLLNHLVYGLRKDNGLKPLGIEAEYDALLSNSSLAKFLQKLPSGVFTYFEGVRKMAAHIYSKALQDTGKKYFVEKSPRYYYIIPELFMLFPNAKFVFLIRNPMTQFGSIMSTWAKNGDWETLRRFRSDLFDAPQLLSEGLKTYGNFSSFVRYEDLVTKPEAEIRKVCDYLKIDFEENMINYGEKVGKLKGYFLGLGDPSTVKKHNKPVPNYIDNWIERFDTPQKLYFAKSYAQHLGKANFEKLGYSYENILKKISEKEIDDKKVIKNWSLITEDKVSEKAKKEQRELETKVFGSPLNKVQVEDNKFVEEKSSEKIIESNIVGKWQIKYGFLKGGFFKFHKDGTFKASLPVFNMDSSGTFSVSEKPMPCHIDLNIEESAYGEAFAGLCMGIYEVEDKMLKLKVSEPNKPRWEDTSMYIYYYKTDH